MEIKTSGAKYSAIVGIGEKIKKLSKESGNEYLMLNRGINQVTNIELNETIASIDFNTNQMQHYAPTTGMYGLKKAINREFFQDNTTLENISITAGGMNALNMIFQILGCKKVYIQSLYWGAYINLFKILNVNYDFYHSLETLEANLHNFENSAVIICDPNNPAGDKFEDARLLQIIDNMQNTNTTVIWDGPYRRLFLDNTDTVYAQLIKYKHVIISESFSKSLGLSGQRVGFIHSSNSNFNKELAIRLLYNGNGINTFAQILIEKLLVTEVGKKAVAKFRKITSEGIEKNIAYLITKKLLATEFYENSIPIGIFVILKKSYQELLKYRIGSVPLNYFSQRKNINLQDYARICVSVPHTDFVRFFKSVN